ncbi:ankyrin repeat domain-containing protein [uncultured Aquimarina sp.]|uniref:ankyrin repeat domain-containing protein n=1 Tax=uncultured Aquimarina sp. TaxID=575652 RepID=UPI0026296640|nr:ankyrin repeat domain-containing protein [uncultured Aquimarina sp.]
MNVKQQFFDACEKGDVKKVASLIPHLDTIDVKTEQGWTGLVKAVFNEHFDVAKLLVSNGADVNATNHKGTTIFMYAKTPVFTSKNTKILSWLIEQGADLNTTEHRSLTVLDYVKQEGASWLEEWLVERGAKYAAEL